MPERGKFINIEGIDGSGKRTQFGLLKQRLEMEGHQVATFDFPQYGSDSAKLVELHLTGKLPDLTPKQISLLFAVDRLAARSRIEAAQDMGALILTNRYVGSNVAYQAARARTPEERLETINFIENLEYGVNNLPRPTLNVITAIDASISQQNVDKKGSREYVVGRDINEADATLQANVAEIYDYFCSEREDFVRIECMGDDGAMLSKEAIHAKIWEVIRKVI